MHAVGLVRRRPGIPTRPIFYNFWAMCPFAAEESSPSGIFRALPSFGLRARDLPGGNFTSRQKKTPNTPPPLPCSRRGGPQAPHPFSINFWVRKHTHTRSHTHPTTPGHSTPMSYGRVTHAWAVLRSAQAQGKALRRGTTGPGAGGLVRGCGQHGRHGSSWSGKEPQGGAWRSTDLSGEFQVPCR